MCAGQLNPAVFKVENYSEFISLCGKADDLMTVNKDHSMKMTRLFKLDSDTDVESDEVIDLSITSVNPYGEHPLFDRLKGKEIRITVEIKDDIV